MIESPVAVIFETLLASIAQLEHGDKHKLWEYLDAELFDDDDDELDEESIAAIQASYADYEAGDYLTIQEYRAQRVRKSA
jgi:hypothetical protein